jgi:hypothetical protein
MTLQHAVEGITQTTGWPAYQPALGHFTALQCLQVLVLPWHDC